MNIPHTLFDGTLSEGGLNAIIEAIKKLFGRKGRLLWVDTD